MDDMAQNTSATSTERWLSLVRFHKEIVKRAEEGFFALPAAAVDADRWSSLKTFQPQSLAGPWELSRKQVRSQDLLHAVAAGRHTELYLGGPGFYGFEKAQDGGWKPLWKPLLYREVTLEEQDGSILLTPAQGVWELSPLISKLLDQRSVAIEDAGGLVSRLLEDAEARRSSSGLTYSDAIADAFRRLVPDLEADVRRTASVTEPPSPWVLFAPIARMGPMLQYLMNDYERLEARLAADETDIGGLAILGDRALRVHSVPETSEILPIVPLTPSQHTAVSNALAGAPLTVVSGPPGCGKSQVVVSLLLNAWARGLKVLFASNNNRAVDVVRERLQVFEDRVPISARAGSKQFNQVTAVLSRISAVVGAADRDGISSTDTQTALRPRLQKQRSDAQDQIDTKIPQRADEALNSALNGYATYCKALETLGIERQRVEAEMAALGYPGDCAASAASWAGELGTWLAAGHEAHERASNTEHERQRLLQMVVDAESRRNDRSGAIGLDPNSQADWGWLITGAGPELLENAWTQFAGFLLNTPAERDLQPFVWDVSWDDWRSAAVAADDAAHLRELAADVRRTCVELAPTVAALEAKQAELGQAEAAAVALGLPKPPRAAVFLLDEWLSHYATYVAIAPSWLNRLPFSTARRERRSLRVVEAQLRSAFPVAVWRHVDDAAGAGRERLAHLVEAGREWLLRLSEWTALQPLRGEIDARFGALRGCAATLKLVGMPAGTDLDAWNATPAVAEARSRLADAASGGWAEREARERAWARLKEVSQPVLEAVAGQPFWQAWSSGTGRSVVDAVAALCRQPDPSAVVAARGYCHAESVPDLVGRWLDGRGAERRRRVLVQQAAALPTAEEIHRKWAFSRLSWLHAKLPTPMSFPKADDPLEAHLVDLERVGQSWRRFDVETRPALESTARAELKWATAQLSAARGIVPPGPEHDSIAEAVSCVLEGPSSDWDTGALRAAFADFSPERLQAALARIDAELGKIAFAEAIAAWVGRLKRDQTTLAAVDHLRHALLRKSRLDEANYPMFRRALPAIPIWITTAQATQAVPLEPDLFDLVVVDEASQCTLTNLLPLLYRGKRLVVIGDPRQLPAIPTITASEEVMLARKFKVEPWMTTLGHVTNNVYDTAEQSLPHRGADVTMLTDHFRSHPQIIGFSNREVYQRQLQIRRDPLRVKKVGGFGAGVHVYKVNGQAERGDNGRSWRNPKEAEAVIELIRDIRDADDRGLTLGVVTPFRAHDDLVSGMLEGEGLLSGVTVGTVDRFQGDERDVVLFSTVLSPGVSDGTATWVEQPFNRINVAVTRAREAFFLVGHLDYCGRQTGILGRLVRYCRDADLLRRTSPEELQLFSWMATRGWSPEVHVVIGDIEVDFVLHAGPVHLVIEVDGDQHVGTTQADKARDVFLTARGYKVRRIPARAVRETPAAVLAQIAEALELEAESCGL